MMNSTALRTLLQLDAEIGQHFGRHPVALADQPKQQMLGPDVVVVEALRLFLRQAQHFARPLRKLLELIVHFFPPSHGRGWNCPPPRQVYL